METNGIINENVVDLFVRLGKLEKVFTTEFDALEGKDGGVLYNDILDKFWNGYSDMMEAFKGLLAETAALNVP